MQKVFEKIIEKLEEKQDIFLYDDSDYGEGKYNAFGEAIEIVKQEAEQYNGGWIPCSERMPETYTVLCCDKYGEMLVGHPYFDEVSNTNYSAESDNEMMYNCIAWQPLPEPYNPTGMNRSKTKDGKYEPYLGGWK